VKLLSPTILKKRQWREARGFAPIRHLSNFNA
jgi:hypothetical protein